MITLHMNWRLKLLENNFSNWIVNSRIQKELLFIEVLAASPIDMKAEQFHKLYIFWHSMFVCSDCIYYGKIGKVRHMLGFPIKFTFLYLTILKENFNYSICVYQLYSRIYRSQSLLDYCCTHKHHTHPLSSQRASGKQ